ncbi:MAG: hypothetical protein MSH10_07910 [Pygmaiobacter massiliensis]|nr:hypothetical protein [Pygmaiobacter massiliensis]
MNQNRSRSGLFLLEFLAAVLIFSLASAICIQLFAAAKLKSDRTRATSAAMSLSQSAAACLQTAQGDFAKAADWLDGFVKDDALLGYYDQNLQPTDDLSNAVYQLTATVTGTEQAQIQITWRGEEIFAISCGWHAPLLFGEVSG